MNTAIIRKEDSDYPKILLQRLGDRAPEQLYYRGDLSILKNHMIGFVCSIQCPGNIIIKTLDTARVLRDKGFVVAGGFHSPMEAEVLEISPGGEHYSLDDEHVHDIFRKGLDHINHTYLPSHTE
jgi:hypothetical protein